VLRALPDLARVSIAGVIAYRAEMIIWILSTLMPLVMASLWTAAAASAPIANFSKEGFARYFAVTLVVRQLTSVWLVWELNYEIRQGKLSNKLLKPVHPLLQHAIDMLAAMPFRVIVLLPVLAILFLWWPALWRTPSLDEAALFGLSVALAWAINFGVQALFATFSFWIDKSDALFGVWFGLWSLCSGYLAPLDVFPAWARDVLRVLPFRGMLGLPVEIWGGFTSTRDAWPEVAVQAAWVVLLWGLVGVTWRRGIVRYGAYGA
jgi:ABC-2 type transport system permease protein